MTSGTVTADNNLERVDICRTCRFRRGERCHAVGQLYSVWAKIPGARCPERLWPGSITVPPEGQHMPLSTMPRQARRPVEEIAVVVVCHNYGRFLAEALASLDAQTLRPREIVLVDDCSSDETDAIGREWEGHAQPMGPWRVYLRRSDAPRESLARRLGYLSTTAPLLCFLDADDRLGPTYLREAAEALAANPLAGIATTDLQQFGDKTGTIVLNPRPIEQDNWIHAGAVVRRTCLDQLADPFPDDFPADVPFDWFLWRRVVRNGWNVVKTPAEYQYRRHPESLTARDLANPISYYHRAQLGRQPVTLFVPVSARSADQFAETLDSLVNEYHDTARIPERGRVRVVLSTASEIPASQRDRLIQIASRVPRFSIVSHTNSRNLPTADRHRPAVRREVQNTMTRIYATVVRDYTYEYLWILEDDVTPPPGALDAMLRGMGPNVASVALPYRSRYTPNYVAWDQTGRPFSEPPCRGLAHVGGNGWGCVLLRRSFAAQIPIRSDRSGDYDPEFYRDLQMTGGVSLVDWSLECQHGPSHARY